MLLRKRTWRNWLPPVAYRDRWIHVVVCSGCNYVRCEYEAGEGPKAADGRAYPINTAYKIRKARWRSTSVWYNPWTWDTGKWQLYPDNDLERLALVASKDD